MIRLVRGNVEKIAHSEEQAKKLMSQGFKRVTNIGPNQCEAKKEETKVSLEDLTVKELREMAKEKGIDAVSSLNKEDLLKVLGDDGNE